VEPIDLVQRPPRPCREHVAGIAFLARSIDKARAALPGGNLGEYFLAPEGMRTLSGLFFRRFGCSEREFIDAVASAVADAEVGAWVRTRADDATVAAWNAMMETVRMRDLDERGRAQFARIYARQTWAEDDLLADVIDAADVPTPREVS
jgi:uncharacterized protein DUF5069